MYERNSIQSIRSVAKYWGIGQTIKRMSNETTETITCEELQQSLRRFCELENIKMLESLTSVVCYMPSGALVIIFSEPLHLHIYGIAFMPWRETNALVAFNAEGAIHLKKRLDENIKKLETKKKCYGKTWFDCGES